MTSEIFYKSMPAMCPDAKIRSVRVRCYRFDGSMAADTFFSVPANLRVRGKYVHGFVTAREGDPDLEFCPHDVCKDAFGRKK